MRWTSWAVGTGAIAVVLVAGIGGCSSEPEQRAAPEIFDLEAGTSVGLDPQPAAERTVVPAADLEALLADLLGEHAELVADVMTAAADGDSTEESVEQLQANTVELTAAINLVYGPDGAAAFDQLWGQHTQFFAEYAVASGDGDRVRQDTAYAKLHDYHLDFSSFADTATGGTAPAEVVIELLHNHVSDLTGYIDAHTSGDAEEAAERLESATSYMSVIADALAGAIAAQDPERFPA
jgi:hypothetical protein